MAVAKLTAIFGSSRRVGRWKVANKSEALVLFGRCHVDFRDAYAEPELETISLKILCLFGSATLVLPQGASVQPSVVSVLASSRLEIEASDPVAELPPLILVTTTIFGRCHATTEQEVADHVDPLEDWALNPHNGLAFQAEETDFGLVLPDPTPVPQVHQRPSMGANVRLGEMESAWTDSHAASEALAPSPDPEALAPPPIPDLEEEIEPEPTKLSTFDTTLAVDLVDVTTLRIGA